MLKPETPREVQILKEYQHYVSLSYQYSKQISAMEDEIESLKDELEDARADWKRMKQLLEQADVAE